MNYIANNDYFCTSTFRLKSPCCKSKRPYNLHIHNTMDILYLLIPISLILISVIILIFLWAIRSGQFDDLEGPAHKILMDDDDLPSSKN